MLVDLVTNCKYGLIYRTRKQHLQDVEYREILCIQCWPASVGHGNRFAGFYHIPILWRPPPLGLPHSLLDFPSLCPTSDEVYISLPKNKKGWLAKPLPPLPICSTFEKLLPNVSAVQDALRNGWLWLQRLHTSRGNSKRSRKIKPFWKQGLFAYLIKCLAFSTVFHRME